MGQYYIILTRIESVLYLGNDETMTTKNLNGFLYPYNLIILAVEDWLEN